MKVYGFFYNDNIHESSAGLMGLWMKEEDAELAMNTHRNEALNKHNKRASRWKQSEGAEWGMEFGMFEAWFVSKLNVNK